MKTGGEGGGEGDSPACRCRLFGCRSAAAPMSAFTSVLRLFLRVTFGGGRVNSAAYASPSAWSSGTSQIDTVPSGRTHSTLHIRFRRFLRQCVVFCFARDMPTGARCRITPVRCSAAWSGTSPFADCAGLALRGWPRSAEEEVTRSPRLSKSRSARSSARSRLVR